MITAGIITLAIGLVLAFVGFGLHLRNIKGIIDDNLSSGSVVTAFAFIGAGGFAITVGGLIAIVGTVLYFF